MLPACTATFVPLAAVLLIVSSLALFPSSGATTGNPRVALPGCEDRCGNVRIPYPFSIDFKTDNSKASSCSHNPSFSIICNKRYDPPRPLLHSLQWTDIYVKQERFYSPPPYEETGEVVTRITFGGISTDNSVSTRGSFDLLRFSGEDLYAWKQGRNQESKSGITQPTPGSVPAWKRLDMKGSSYRLMGDGRNALLVGGCSGGAVVIRDNKIETVVGCATACIKDAKPRSWPNKTCYGLECCQSSIPTFHDFVEMNFLNFADKKVSEPVTAVVVDLSYLQSRAVSRDLSEFGEAPTVLQWRVEDLEVNSQKCSNSSCVKGSDGGYRFTCKSENYHDNPYLPYGCQAIPECWQCPDDCISARNNTFHCPPPPANLVVPPELILGLGIPLASMFVLILVFVFYQFLKKRKEITAKKRNFKRNGGLLLHQQTHTSDSSIERTKLFTSNELEKATNDFNENRVLGRGGQGTVYKGMLVDGTIVAIKKSKKVSETQLQQFINEVVILSQVNHRNVVKLFGCCLETDVPLLVYEYVPNGTLYQHLHNPYEDFHITWKMRLQIAMESAEAIAYLHSWSFSPIYHRDIKTSNILLDGKYKAKVSDFGTSKTLSLDQTHVTTQLQGTIGYMDPEFLQSSQFTEKSDVYSFGIVILELLTSKKAIFWDKHEECKRLASEFLAAMENSNLYDLVDARVLEEAQEQEIESVAELARRCLNLNGKERPAMKEVAMALQVLSSKNSAPNQSYQEFITTHEKIVGDQICTTRGCSLSISSSYGPR